MTVDLDVVPPLRDLAVAANQIRRADDAHEFPAVERFLLPDAVLLRDGVIRIGEEREVQVELVGELLLARLIQNADAEHRGFTLFEPRKTVTESARFFRTPRRVVFRVKVEDNG